METTFSIQSNIRLLQSQSYLKQRTPTLDNAVHHLGCKNHLIQVLKVKVEADGQIPHDILALHHSIL